MSCVGVPTKFPTPRASLHHRIASEVFEQFLKTVGQFVDNLETYSGLEAEGAVGGEVRFQRSLKATEKAISSVTDNSLNRF